MPKTWEQKHRDAKAPHVAVLEKPFGGLRAGQRLFVASPALLEERIAALPRGATLEPAALRAQIAVEHGADATCAASTGIFLRIVAERALERLARGEEAAPFWRVVAPDSPLARKLSCGPDFLRQRREAEREA